MKREDGYYWVKLNNTWGIARYYVDRDSWLVVGCEVIFNTEEFQAISETRILPPNN